MAGFTLIELIIVIAIIAILAGAIFVAIDPARRLHESRNARRSNDISTILEALKTYQADHEGDLLASVSSMTAGNYYQIGVDNSGCNRTCAGPTTQSACVDLSGIGSDYLAKVPFDPKEGSEENTGYAITKDSNGTLTLLACDGEGEGSGGNGNIPDLRVSR